MRSGPVVLTAAVFSGDPDWWLLTAVTGAAEATVLRALRAAAEVGLLAVEDGAPAVAPRPDP
ncbi:MAG TPA: hypothetical protein VIY28_03540 [Pseudonocardiaceae bacterium]